MANGARLPVGIVGGSGYGGGELLRLLTHHPRLETTRVAANRAAGARVGELFPNLWGTAAAEIEIEAAEPGTLPDALADCPLVFLATPAAVSMALAPLLVAQGTRVVDLSGAFRLPAPVYARWYGATHDAPQLTPAVYGLPELFRDELRGADLVAGPGCSPTAVLLGLWPLTGLVDPATVTVAVLTGLSGAGRGLREDLHASHAMANVAPYGAPHHRHTPEMEGVWARAAARDGHTIAPAVTFVPHLVPMSRGLLATATATLAPGVDADAVVTAVRDAYADEPFVTVTDDWPTTAHVLGGNGAHVHVAVDERVGRVITSCAIDNMGKGAAGQAVQAANTALGDDETSGLTGAGVYP